jgi:hypothetical protein
VSLLFYKMLGSRIERRFIAGCNMQEYQLIRTCLLQALELQVHMQGSNFLKVSQIICHFSTILIV